MVRQNIKLDLIKDNPFNPRSYYHRDKIIDLASSIAAVGLIEVPQARKVDGHYELACGGYRHRAFEYLFKKNPKKWAEMPVDIVNLTDKQMALLGLEENLKRDDITPMDVANAVAKYFETFPKTTEEELAKELSMTQGNISNMRRVVKLPKEVLDKVNEEVINFTMARELCILVGLNGGSHREWNSKAGKEVDVIVDDKELMLETVKHITANTYNKCPATVNGMRKAIFMTAGDHFPRLQKVQYSRWETLFDTKECMKCEKVLKADETQSQKAHFCTDVKCWEKHKAAHDKAAALKAKQKMEADIAARVVKDINQPQISAKETNADSPPSAEKLLTKSEVAILEKAQATDLEKETTEEKLHEERRRKQLEGQPNYPCLKCAKIGTCEGTSVRSESYKNEATGLWEGRDVCKELIPATLPTEKITEKAQVKIPAELLDKVKEKAGTRAEVLDIHKLRAGSYGHDLIKGHVLLDYCLEEMSDPQECMLRCTEGFHYAFDSGKPNETYRVCTNPKCVSKKKAAATRERNARGILRKKAEAAAIDVAVNKTEKIGKPEMELILYAQMAGKHIGGYYGSNETAVDWLLRIIGIEKPKGYFDRKDFGKTIMDKLEAMDEAKLAKVIVSFMIEAFKGDSRDMARYKIETADALKLLGVEVTVPNEAKEPEKTLAKQFRVESDGGSEEGEEEE
jgi:ParB/RepB/Spo0J family partition protein